MFGTYAFRDTLARDGFDEAQRFHLDPEVALDSDARSHEGRKEYALSPHIAVLPLSATHLIVTHVLGRRKVIGNERVAAEIARFKNRNAVDSRTATPAFQALRSAGIVQAATADEAAWIRAAYARAATLAGVHPVPALPEPLAFTEIDGRNDALVGQRLAKSDHLATIALGDGAWLATHPSGVPAHLGPDLWHCLQSFRGGRPVERSERHVARFLMDRKLLWRDADQERDACFTVHGLSAARLPNLETTQHAGDLFRQIHRPYTRAHIDRPPVAKRVALLGPCASQQFAECLEYHGFALGWSIETMGLLEPEPRLGTFDPHIVIVSAGQFIAHLVHLAGLGQWAECDALVQRIVQTVQNRVRQVREWTPAPIAIPAARPPTLGVFWPGARDTYRLEALFARVNAAIADATDATPGVCMLDELDARERLQIGIYWDDRYNAAAHRAPLSSWNWVVLKPDRTDRPPPTDGSALVPPATPQQSDPSGAMTLAILELMLRLAPPYRIDTVIFEPRGLLWSETRTPEELDRAAQRNFLVDVEDYGFAGIAEALAAIARRGVRLVCVTDEVLPDLERGIAAKPGIDTLLARSHIAEVHCTADKEGTIADLLARAPGRWALRIDFTVPNASSRKGLIVVPATERWGLRELLLRSPLLAGLPAGDLARAASGSTVPAAVAADTDDALRRLVREAIRQSLAAEARRPPEELDDVEDLADIGFDSLASTRFLLRIESILGTHVDSWERSGPRLYDIRALEVALISAMRAAGRSNPPKRL